MAFPEGGGVSKIAVPSADAPDIYSPEYLEWLERKRQEWRALDWKIRSQYKVKPDSD